MAETNNTMRSSSHWKSFYSFVYKVKRFPGSMRKTIWNVGKDDPRRVVHSLKVGLALTLVSLLYLMEPLFKGIGENAMWAVMTVVVVMEFTAGGTLCKGLNRGLGTLLAGSLAFFIRYLADVPGQIFHAIFIGAAVFILGAAATYVRFIPYIKKNYDYGVMIFLLTFNLIIVSSYRVDNVWSIGKDRIYTICIGVGLCLVMSLFVFPNWSGEELHKSTISKLEGLAKSIEVSVMEYFYDSEKQANDDSSEDLIYKCYEAVLDSKSKDETLAIQANWEPRYSRCCHRIPWQQYAKVGAALRHFSYTVVALHGCLQSEIQTPRSIRDLYKDSCIRLAQEVSKVLRAMANSIRKKHKFSLQILSNNLNEALQDLDGVLKSQPQLLLGSNNGRSRTPRTPKTPRTPNSYKLEEESRILLSRVKSDCCSPVGSKSKEHSREQTKEGQRHKVLRPQLSKIIITSLEFSEALPFAAFTSLLVEMVAKLDHVMDEVEELGRMSHFKEFRDDDDNNANIVVTCDRPKMNIVDNNDLPSYGAE
ncbi:putative aluminum-activated malate transporter [Medicago truncatula]|uniref:Aluminum activated malate transporter n=1 Tax=Medicago truncatula TaxID=3880 RepID=A0A072W2H7_MEDTR|nr:aluminum-activated malate transporter 12 [Medicago truncatula]KEH44440.1 aluminum activated malate transporter [Medicago truncatula]RHN82666.1 putative aluminum-activated malate transporter [Medicago truncatula]